MSETPKPRRSRAKKPVEPQVEQPIQEEQPEVDERSRRYRESEPGVYAPPPEMVALNDERLAELKRKADFASLFKIKTQYIETDEIAENLAAIKDQPAKRTI